MKVSINKNCYLVIEFPEEIDLVGLSGVNDVINRTLKTFKPEIELSDALESGAIKSGADDVHRSELRTTAPRKNAHFPKVTTHKKYNWYTPEQIKTVYAIVNDRSLSRADQRVKLISYYTQQNLSMPSDLDKGLYFTRNYFKKRMRSL